MNEHLRKMSVVALALVLTAAACGGDDEEPSGDGGTGATPSGPVSGEVTSHLIGGYRGEPDRRRRSALACSWEV